MKKDEAERQVRYLCTVWARHKGIPLDGSIDPSFIEFWIWLKENGHASVLDFKARGGPEYAANRWFDEEFKQTWKN